LEVSGAGGADYGACTFEDNVPNDAWESIWEKANEQDGKSMEVDYDCAGNTESFEVTAHEVGEVDESFIELMRKMQDYDDSKHHNWFIVE
ncbi:hypothetical protein, partial [Staphylococcus aureus]|uniref:hypothetical protein n=1 Tax=Staphylococcus aureus TaxID=1280 RepID=UPI0039BE7485